MVEKLIERDNVRSGASSADLERVILAKGQIAEVDGIALALCGNRVAGAEMMSGVIDVEKLMNDMGERGITVILKVDDVRAAERDRPWTVVLSGPGVVADALVRTDAVSLTAALRFCFKGLRARPGDWDWLPEV
ncbi:hypothetical protein [Actinokineospora diospyrosa]|uniref:Roadblock/LAMTOR2 domain-containing protein n=1 Tax=Actinokineospora diospyrosa TaxID=103728 RepID=A0ABT1IC45_9PSEU|nr:hypothetical protein [Actinokineospora diospyrosa]MCP2270210.1 hypothetical protein [Actinokineospora diospyrosa]